MSSHPDPHPFPKPPARPRAGKLRLPRGMTLQIGLVTAFSRILSAAKRCARLAAADPVAATHEYRKAIRRARAVVSLLRPALGKTAASGLRGELRRAFRETGPLRDADILLAALRAAPGEDPDRAVIEQQLEAERQSRVDPAAVADVLRRGARVLSPLPSALRVTLPSAFSVSDLERGLARSFRRTRNALTSAVASRLDAHLHGWRKRVKELRYQVELLASTGSPELKKREKALGSLAQDLGDVTDLIVLRGELARRRLTGSLPPAPALDEWLDGEIRDRSGRLLSRGEEMFTESPRDFARHVLAERG
jgi:CHAD domain-containing protein